jgi:ABC-type nitrate/sulfonate/bicarbonate transport system substrate-binding protein
MMYVFEPNGRPPKSRLAVAAKKIVLSAIVPLLMVSAFTSSEVAWSADAPTEIKVVYSSFSGSSVPVWIAQERGLFTKYGLKSDLVFATGRRPTQALVAGEVQFISTAASATIPAAVAGADVVILAGASNVSPLEIFSKPEIKRPEQLRGKRLGITTFGSATDAAARFALPKWGLKSGADVVLLQLGGVPEVLAALGSGAIDAGILSDPTTIAARKAGFHRLASLRELGLNVQHAAIAARRSYIGANPAVTERFLRAYCEAILYFHHNREGTLQVMSQYLRRMDRESIVESYDNHLTIIPREPYPTLEGIQFILDELAKGDPRAKQIKPEALIDKSFIEKFDREGFFKKKT